MAIAFDKVVGTGSDTFAAGFVSLTVASGGVAAGNLCVAVLATEIANDTWSSVTDPRGNVWTIQASYANNVGAVPFTTAVAWCVLTTALQAGDTLTFNTVGTATADKGVDCVAYSGVKVLSPLDQTNRGQDDIFPQTAQFDSGDVTTTQADEILVGCHIGRGTANTFTASTGFTPRSTFSASGGGNGFTLYVEDMIVSSIVTDKSDPVAANVCYWNANIVTFLSSGNNLTGLSSDTPFVIGGFGAT